MRRTLIYLLRLYRIDSGSLLAALINQQIGEVVLFTEQKRGI